MSLHRPSVQVYIVFPSTRVQFRIPIIRFLTLSFRGHSDISFVLTFLNDLSVHSFFILLDGNDGFDEQKQV